MDALGMFLVLTCPWFYEFHSDRFLNYLVTEQKKSMIKDNKNLLWYFIKREACPHV